LTFLNTAILFALSAALLPLIIHLFTRVKHKNIPFSTLEFLKELEKKQIKRLKLRQILLLILRFLIIICLVLAFARPTFVSHFGTVAPNAKTTAAIILDNSASMNVAKNGTTLFDLAQSKIVELTNAMRDGDEMYILTTQDTLNPTAFSNAFSIQKNLKSVNLNYGQFSLDAAITKAHQLVKNSNNVNKEVYLFSDVQKSAFGNDTLWLDESKNFVLPYRIKELQNLSLVNIDIGSSILEKGKVIDIQATIENYNDSASENKLAQLFVNGKRAAQKIISLAPHSRTTESLKFTLNSTGHISGYIILEDDDLLDDNRRYFSIYVPDKIRVVLAGNPSNIQYLSLALKPTLTSQQYQVQKVAKERTRFLSFKDFDIVVLSDIAQLETGVLDRLVDFVQSGKGLLYIAGQNSNIKYFNNTIAPKFGFPFFNETIGSLDANAATFSFGKIDYSHPIFYGVFEKETFNMSNPFIKFALKAGTQKSIQKIIDYSNGDPFLYEKSHPNGKLLVFTTGLNLESSDLPHRTLFAPLITRAVSYLAAPKQLDKKVGIGAQLSHQLSPNLLSADIAIVRPDETVDIVTPQVLQSGQWIFYNSTDIPGIYKLVAENKTLNQWAINLSPDESDFAALSNKEIKDKYNFETVDTTSDLYQLIKQSRFGQELWKYFAILAFIFLILEMLIYRQKGEILPE
jgi:hypothetical protein